MKFTKEEKVKIAEDLVALYSEYIRNSGKCANYKYQSSVGKAILALEENE